MANRHLSTEIDCPMDVQLSPSAELLQQLIRCQSVTPVEGGALDVLQGALERLGFDVHRIAFSDKNTADVQNLYARLGTGSPHICFAGHTDVVPVGEAADWTRQPFAGDILDGQMIGRGAVDMKGGIACFIAAVEEFLAGDGAFGGSISLLITGDEEGPAINGTDKLLKWAGERGERFDAAIVGEPTCLRRIGDTVKNGRRGSMSGKLTVTGIQGHAAYPHLADNPVRGMVDLLHHLLATPLDEGTADFQPSTIEVTSVDVGNRAVNVIAARATAIFNVRFNDNWSGDTMRDELLRRFDEGAACSLTRQGRDDPVSYDVEWLGRVSPVFLTEEKALTKTLLEAINTVTGEQASLSTGGGTSDARFIKDYCPVVEFGLVGQTMHQIDERVALDDLDTLSRIYHQFLVGYFDAGENASPANAGA